jgi:hypothetical protein
MSEDKYDEGLRLVGTCPSCTSDRLYVTDLIAGLGMPGIVAVECAECMKPGEAWCDPKGPGMVIKWDGSNDVVPTDYAVSDASFDGR